MAGYSKGTRVVSGDVGKKKNEESGSLSQPSSVTSETNAKLPVSGVQNKAHEKRSDAELATRKSS